MFVDGELGRVLGSERLIWFRNAYNLNLRIVQRMFQESLDMPVNQTDDADPERSPTVCRRGLSLERCGDKKRKRVEIQRPEKNSNA